jgi:hypothetical protein
MQVRQYSLKLWASALTSVALLGCGSGESNVTGQISLDGKPVAGTDGVFGSVVFYPEGGSGAPASGVIDASGQYELSTGASASLPPGPYLVAVTIRKSLPRKQDELPSSKLLSPPRYADAKQSGLRADVTAGSNELNFSLESTKTK